jgi:hypothetical protein
MGSKKRNAIAVTITTPKFKELKIPREEARRIFEELLRKLEK